MLVLAQNRFKRSGGLGKRQDSFHYETSNGLDLPQQENNVRRHRYKNLEISNMPLENRLSNQFHEMNIFFHRYSTGNVAAAINIAALQENLVSFFH